MTTIYAAKMVYLSTRNLNQNKNYSILLAAIVIGGT